MADRNNYDTIVIGAGLLGSATAYALSRKKKNSTLLIDAREKGHGEGSSHGHSRIIRTVASESPQFGAMAKESFERIREMNRPGRFVAEPVDALFISFVESMAFKELAEANREPTLVGREIFERWGIRLPEGGVGTVDKLSGILNPSALRDIFYDEIGTNHILWRTPVTRWEAASSGVTITTENGQKYSAGKLVLAVGGWLPALLACGTVDKEVSDRLKQRTIERIPLYYFDYPVAMPPVIPVTLLENGHPDMYAMPEFDTPVARVAATPRYLKVGFHKGIIADTPEAVDRTVQSHEEQFAITYMRERLGLDLTLHHTGLCLYAMPPDLRGPGETQAYNELPLIGCLPRTPSVFLAAYGAGICAKHALVIGDQVRALVEDESPSYDLTEFEPAHRLRLGR